MSLEMRFHIETHQLGWVNSYRQIIIFCTTLIIPTTLQYFKKYFNNIFHRFGLCLLLLIFLMIFEYHMKSLNMYTFLIVTPYTIVNDIMWNLMEREYLHIIPVDDIAKALAIKSVYTSIVGLAAPLYSSILQLPIVNDSLLKYILPVWLYPPLYEQTLSSHQIQHTHTHSFEIVENEIKGVLLGLEAEAEVEAGAEVSRVPILVVSHFRPYICAMHLLPVLAWSVYLAYSIPVIDIDIDSDSRVHTEKDDKDKDKDKEKED